MRCNVGVHPTLLADQHLLAEVRELRIVPGQLSKRGRLPKAIPAEFTLGKGHISFFSNKLGYLQKRWLLLRDEAAYRGFRIKAQRFWTESLPDADIWNDYTPTPEAHRAIISRIIERVEAKPTWYRKFGTPITGEFLESLKASQPYTI